MAEVTMTFNGISKPYIRVLHGLKRSAWAPITRELLEVPGVAGAYLTGTRTEVREITVPISIVGASYMDLQRLKEDLAEWLVHEEVKALTFSDEPNRTYYAVIEGNFEPDEILKHGQGTLTFICPDPYKYGIERVFPLSDQTVVPVGGTASTKPIIRLTAQTSSTFVMVQNGTDEYQMIGEPAEVEKTVVDSRELLLSEDGSTISTWTQAVPGMEEQSSGTIGYDGAGITAPTYGTGNGYHGPAYFKEVPETGDFEIEMRGQLLSGVKDVAQAGFILYDSQLRTIGKMAAMDNTLHAARKVAEGRVGPFVGNYVNYAMSSRNYKWEWENFPFYLRLTRKGQTFTFYAARVLGDGSHMNPLRVTWTSKDENHLGNLKYVGILIKKYKDSPSPHTNRIDYVKAWKLVRTTEDQTPYIVYPGDEITLDHAERRIMVNGIDYTGFKAFGGRYFDLNPGQNVITIEPSGIFTGNITFKERYR